MDRLSHNDEQIDFREDDEINHINYLAEFREKVYPIYEKQGVTFAEAMLFWRLNIIHNAIRELVDERRSDDY